MEELLQNIEWMTVLVSAFLSFGLGWLWYSPALFLKSWLAGIGEPKWQVPMWMPISAQFGSILLLSIIINLAVADGHVGHAILVGFTIAGFIKASGLYSGKTIKAVSIEVSYIVAIFVVMFVVNMMM